MWKIVEFNVMGWALTILKVWRKIILIVLYMLDHKEKFETFSIANYYRT